MLYKAIYTTQNRILGYFKREYSEVSFLLFFRIMIGLIAIIEILSLKGDLSLFFSSSNTMIPQELMYMETGVFKYLHPLSLFLKEKGLFDFFYQFTLSAYLVSLLFLIIGFLTRFSAFFALILQLIIFKSFAQFNYGYDQFMTISLFYCFIFPVGKYYSCDNLIFKKKNVEMFFNYQGVLQIHLSIAYFFSGLAKALDSGWWNGKSVWNALASLDGNFYPIPIIYIVGGISTVLLELSYPILVNFKKTRKIIVIAMILMHLFIGLMMELFAFSIIMIVWNIASFGELSLVKEKKLQNNSLNQIA
ncbi:hypothetical protein Q73A0000_05255 [Kaistella flava (ex Peng et al. 2021)]|uniref:HTTM-like domain-containing protein n=1 Tax=Kaistella flava (ex Peng et al. 2021) TaxID=2038776 RepID=A0A7M2Y824_9FLAO|nr:hypothetical protein [Kaistella flava (ex Peng et al. 2021)]QOW09814.1 hypothetical protein Q73A0000_05255 [Kaistella flava (ex Peng et al. 2021)]